ncbi:MAG TPA: hypothetical protein VIG99_32830 [Myxococcaceae bacterium]|jgi:hypothetical protein
MKDNNGMKMSWLANAGWLVAAVWLASCGVEPGIEPEPLDSSQEPLYACSNTYHHGGNLWEQSYTVTAGCSCGPGYQRTNATAWNNGGGSCYVLGWASGDPNDCKAVVQIHDSGGFVWGDCYVTVNKEIVRADSCVSRCGGKAPAGCWCDSACAYYGDCCSDHSKVCK